MLAEKKRNTNIGVGIELVMQLIGRLLLLSQDAALVLLGLPVALAGLALFIWDCMSHCEGKGHSNWLGLLGLLSILGLIVLIFLPDRHKRAIRTPNTISVTSRSSAGPFDTRNR